MFLVYNSDVLSETDFRLSINDRAFHYGDGLFETIRYENGRVWFWPDHFARLTTGMAALQLKQPGEFTAETISHRILELLSANALINQPARIKIQVWRQPGGLYTPTRNSSNVLITVQPGNPFSIEKKANVGVYGEFRIAASPISAFKTLNALPYVLAGLYKQNHTFDDVLLLDANGNLAECLASTLFWYRNQTLFTPSLQTGCINGIVRQQLLRLAPTVGVSVCEGMYKPTVLTQAEAVFCTNVMGIQLIGQLNGLPLKSPAPAVDTLLCTLFAQVQRG